METAEYHYYIFPEISSWEHAGNSKICHRFDHKVANPDPALDLDGLYETGHLCPKCAFYCGLWYDRGKGSSILEHIKIKVRPTHPKSPSSPYWIEKIDLFDEAQSDIQQCSITKIEEHYHKFVEKKVYKEADFAALSQTQQILSALHQRIAKKGAIGISIFQEIIK